MELPPPKKGPFLGGNGTNGENGPETFKILYRSLFSVYEHASTIFRCANMTLHGNYENPYGMRISEIFHGLTLKFSVTVTVGERCGAMSQKYGNIFNFHLSFVDTNIIPTKQVRNTWKNKPIICGTLTEFQFTKNTCFDIL